MQQNRFNLTIWCLTLCLGIWGFGNVKVHSQPRPYDPQWVVQLKAKLKKTEDRTEKAGILLDLFDQLKNVDASAAYVYNDQALTLTKALNNKALLGRALCNKGGQFFYSYELDKAREHYQQAMDLCSNRHTYAELDTWIRANENLGAVYTMLSDFKRALAYKHAALDNCGEGKEWIMRRCIINKGLAHIYIGLRQYSKAEYLLESNLKAYATQPESFETLDNAVQLANHYQNERKTKQAIQLAQQTLEKAKPYPSLLMQLYVVIYIANKDLDNDYPDLSYLRKACHLADSLKYTYQKFIYESFMCLHFMHENRLDSSGYYIEKAMSAWGKVGIVRDETLLDTYSRYLLKSKRYSEALLYKKRYIQIRDSSITQQTQAFAQNRINSYVAEQTQKKLNQQYQARIQHEKQLKEWSVLALVFLGLLSSGGVYGYRKYRQRNTQLGLKQTLILRQREALQALNAFKVQLFQSIAQDFRHPLQQIQTVLEDLQQQHTPLGEALALQQLNQHTVQVTAQLEEVLCYVRLQMEAADQNAEKINMAKICQELQTEIQVFYYQGEHPTLSYQTANDVELFTDPSVLKVVLKGLLLQLLLRIKNRTSTALQLNVERDHSTFQLHLGREDALSTPETDFVAPDNQAPLYYALLEHIGGKLKLYRDGFLITLPS